MGVCGLQVIQANGNQTAAVTAAAAAATPQPVFVTPAATTTASSTQQPVQRGPAVLHETSPQETKPQIVSSPAPSGGGILSHNLSIQQQAAEENIDLEELEQFAKTFKRRRIELGKYVVTLIVKLSYTGSRLKTSSVTASTHLQELVSFVSVHSFYVGLSLSLLPTLCLFTRILLMHC